MPRASGASKVRTRSTSRPGRLRPCSLSILCESQRISRSSLATSGRIYERMFACPPARLSRLNGGEERVVSQLPLTGEEISGAEALIPERPTLKSLREAAANCRACPLWENATQTVFGEGRKAARVMLIGEQPGDREDIEGHPFVGPAGRVLDQALEQAGIERGDAYVMNVVKHFKWKPKGKRRIHQAPKAEEIKACAPWLEAELEV